jgi:membrane protease YdiL (CAAX protease family)
MYAEDLSICRENTVTVSKRTSLATSLGAIVLYWIYQIISQHPDAPLPAHFSDLVWRIVRNKIIMLVALFLLLRLEGEGFEGLGLSGQRWPKHLGVGLIFGLVMFIALNVVLGSVMSSLLPRPVTSGPSIFIFFKEPRNLLAWLPIGIFGGGVVEELQRIFTFTRFEKWLGRPGLILGIVLSSVMFGLGHRYQGLGIALSTALSGVLFALVYLRRRSALEPITAHAFSDVLAILGTTLQAR